MTQTVSLPLGVDNAPLTDMQRQIDAQLTWAAIHLRLQSILTPPEYTAMCEHLAWRWDNPYALATLTPLREIGMAKMSLDPVMVELWQQLATQGAPDPEPAALVGPMFPIRLEATLPAPEWPELAAYLVTVARNPQAPLPPMNDAARRAFVVLACNWAGEAVCNG